MNGPATITDSPLGSTKSIQNKELLDYVRDLLNQRRVYYEPNWYSDLHAYENNHFITINPNNSNFQFSISNNQKFMIQYPEVKKQVDGFQNLLMAANPVYQVYPTDYGDPLQQQQAKDQSLFLKQHYLDWHEDNVLHSLVHNAGVLPISFIETAVSQEFDIESNQFDFTVVPRVYDAFDVLFDPRYLFDENPCIVKIIRTTNDAIAKSRLYKDFQESVVTSGTQDYKEIYYIDKFGNSNNSYSNRVLIYECHVKDGADIKVVTIDGQGRVMRDKRIKNVPFWTITPFQPSSGNAYQPSILENLLPINRAMDLTAQRIQSMVYKHVKGAYMMPAATQISLSDEDGIYMKYRGAVAPSILPVPQIPEYAWQYLNFTQMSSDRYGISAQVLGSAPKGSNVRSGKMMDKTSQATMQQQKMYMDNFTYTLKRSAEVMVLLMSRILTKPKKVTVQTPNQEYQTKQFVGQDYYDTYKDVPGVVPLPKSFKKLTVEIEDESTHGIDAKRGNMKNLLDIYIEAKEKAPELMPEILALFLKTGDMATVMSEAAMDGTLAGSDALNTIVENNRMGVYDSNPEFKKALGVVLKNLANDPSLEQPMSQQPIQTRSGSGKPLGPQPPEQPQQPSQGGQGA